MDKRILVIAPHPDDEIIGCGGTILKHVENGDKVFVFFVTNGEIKEDKTSYEKNCLIRRGEVDQVAKSCSYNSLIWPEISARDIQENYTVIRNRIEKVFRKLKPNVVYTTHKNEKDFDHKQVFNITKEAYFMSKIAKDHGVNNVKADIYGYEVWTPISNIYKLNDIDEFYEKKKKLINLYNSQVEQISYADGIIGLNQYRGTFFGNSYFAEAFTHISI